MEKETHKLKEISTFTFKEKVYKLVEPSAAMVKEAKRRRSIKFVEGIKEGLFTKKQLQDVLMERSPDFFIDFNQNRQEILQNISETEELLGEVEDPEQLESLSHILVIYRAQLVEQEQILRELFESTAEESADNERNSYLVFCMLRTESGDSMGDDFSDFLENISFEFFDRCKYYLLCWEHNLDPNWEEALPEAKAMLRAHTMRAEELKKAEEEQAKKESEKSSKKATSKKATKSSTKSKTATKKAPRKSTSKKKTTTKRKSTKKAAPKKSEELTSTTT